MLSGLLAHRSRGFLLALVASAFLLAPIAPVAGPWPSAVSTAQAAAPVSYAATIADGRAAAKELMTTSGAASMSVALVDGTKVVWQETFGVADRATGAKPTSSTMYGIGSVSKMFVTMAVMQLVDAGEVSLDTPVVTYLPTFRMADPEYAQITVRMLLDHSAGLPGSDYFNTLTTAPNPDYMARQFLAGLATQRLKTTPGSMSVYCNDCFTLAEMVVESVSGEPYAQYVTDELFVPMGMTHSRYPTEAFAEGTYAHSHTPLAGAADTGRASDTGRAPGAQISAVVEAVGYAISSTNAEDLAERMILHALVDKGTLPKTPAIVGATKLPIRTPTAAQVAAVVGVYGAGGNTFRVTADAAGALTLSSLATGGWVPLSTTTFTLRSDGAFWAPNDKGTSIRAVTGWGRRYLDLRDRAGYGHYRTDLLLGERVLPGKPLTAAWQAREGKTWLIVTDVPTSTNWGAPPRIGIVEIPDLPGYVGTAGDGGGGGGVTLIDPSTSDALGAMFLVIPTAQGRDLADVVFLQRGGEEWLRTGSAVARPQASVPVLALGANTVTIGTEGYAEWRSVAAASALAIAGTDTWKLYDADLALVASGVGNAASVAATAGAYLEVFGKAGATTTVTVTAAAP